MTEDVENVQPESASGGADSKTEVTTEVNPQPSTEEIVSQKIKDAIALETEKYKREIQSAKDKAKAEIESARREAQYSKETLSSFKGTLGNIDPEVARNLELEEYRAKDKARQTVEYEQSVAQQQQALIDSFNTGFNQHLKDIGLDPTDKRIDWGEDSKSLLEKQQKILSSIGKIQKANQKDAEKKQAESFKEMETKLRKDLGLDSVDTSTPVGGGKDRSKWTADDYIDEGLAKLKKK
jgi:hypothetical protein